MSLIAETQLGYDERRQYGLYKVFVFPKKTGQ